MADDDNPETPSAPRKPLRRVEADPKTGHIRIRATRVRDDESRDDDKAPRTSHLGESKRVEGRVVKRQGRPVTDEAGKQGGSPEQPKPSRASTQSPEQPKPSRASTSPPAATPTPPPSPARAPQPSKPYRQPGAAAQDGHARSARSGPDASQVTGSRSSSPGPSAPAQAGRAASSSAGPASSSPVRTQASSPAARPAEPPQAGSSAASRTTSKAAPAARPEGSAPQRRAPPPEQGKQSRGAKPEASRRDDRTKQAEQRDLMSAMKRQSRIRARQEAEEARRLEQQSRELMKSAKKRVRFEKELEKHQEYVASLGDQLGMRPDRPLVEVPPLPPGQKQVEFETFNDGMAHVRISYDSLLKEYRYEVLEPRLNETEKEALEFLRDTLVRTLEGRGKRGDDWTEYLTGAIKEAIRDHSVLLDVVSTQRVRYHLLRDFLGYGPINVLMKDPMIEDISCDGPGIPLYLFHRQYESIKTNLVLDEETQLDAFVIRLAQMSGKHISIADPLLDATLPDGSRLQSTLSREVTTRGSSFTIRKFRSDPLTPPDLAHYGTMSPEMAGYLWFLMEHGMSMVIAGGTASGKTTTLNAACQFIPFQKKVVSIEDTREINLQHENWIAGVTRSGFGGEGGSGKRTGTIDMYDLLGAALRQRPEYLLVGEVRGAEALTLFQAMATGHAVYSTMHADSVQSAVYRLENEPINVPRMMLQTIDVLAVQQQVRIKDRMTRRITDITEVVGFDAETGDLLTNTVFEWDVVTDKHNYLGKSHILERVMQKQNLTERQVEAEWRNRVRVIEWMIHKGIRRYDEVAPVVAQYYRDPEAVLAQIDRDEKELHYSVDTSAIRVAPVGAAVSRIPEEEPEDAYAARELESEGRGKVGGGD